jgi:hypothetical protein
MIERAILSRKTVYNITGTTPDSVEELYQRFDALLESYLSGKKRDKVRIQIDW